MGATPPEQDEATFLARAPKLFHLPFLLGLYTGQRQGDVLRLPWSSYDGKVIRLRQRKTNARVVVPVISALKIALDGLSKTGPIIVLNSEQHPWSSSGFGSAWRRACRKAGITGLTYHDLRGSCVTRLALAGCTVPEICAITGHSLKDAGRILEHHYLDQDPRLAEAAMRKLEENVRRTTV